MLEQTTCSGCRFESFSRSSPIQTLTLSDTDSGVHIPGSNPESAHPRIWGMLMKFSKSLCSQVPLGPITAPTPWASVSCRSADAWCSTLQVLLKVLVLRPRASAVSARLRNASPQACLRPPESETPGGMPSALHLRSSPSNSDTWSDLRAALGQCSEITLWHGWPGDITNFRTICPLSSTKWQNVLEISIFSALKLYLPGTWHPEVHKSPLSDPFFIEMEMLFLCCPVWKS